MQIGDKVVVQLGKNRQSNAHVLEINDTYIRVSGDEELSRCKAEGREPVGLCFGHEKIVGK
jgi:hypothetical protein